MMLRFKRPPRTKGRRINLYYAGMALLFGSGMILAYTLMFTLREGPYWWLDVVPNFGWALFGALVAILLMNAARREALVLYMLEWLRTLDNLLSEMAPPLNTEKMHPVGKLFTDLFEENCGWVLLVRAPGLLIRGEVIRRKYLPMVEVKEESSWNTGWVESRLKNEIEGNSNQNEEIMTILDENGEKYVAVYNISLSQTEDIAAGVAVVIGRKKVKIDPLVFQAFSLGVDMVIQRINSILMEVIHRRRGLGVENLGLVMRVLAHELNNDLQGAINNIDAYEDVWEEQEETGVRNLKSNITRAGFWAGLMREAPFLVDEVLPFKRNEVCLNDALERVLEEAKAAWPDIVFVVEMEDEIQVIGDHHMRSILRNLIHNAASYSPRKGRVKIRAEIKEEFARFYVEDEGPGVEPDDVDKIFAPLESLKKGRKRGKRADYGMGVGLTVSRAIARAYGGELICHSNKEVSGGVFEVVLPLSESEAEIEEMIDE